MMKTNGTKTSGDDAAMGPDRAPDTVPHVERIVSRRDILTRTGLGIGSVALSTLLGDLFAREARGASAPPLSPKKAPLPSKVKHVIHIFASGAPSHLDTFDPKPALEKFRGQSLPGSGGVAFPSPFTFAPCGKSGLMMNTQLLPNLARMADDLCVIRSMKTDVPAHPIAQKMMNTGSLQLSKPSLGAWVLYGLGTENQDLPGFVTLGGSPEWRQAAFLPSLYQGTRADFGLNKPVDKVLMNLRNEFTGPDSQRKQLDLARQLNASYGQQAKDEQLDARIESFELAFKMQTAATDAFDVNKESVATRESYGRTEFGAKLLCARRLVERGVRFVQVELGGWDHHQQLAASLTRKAGEMDQPVAALLADLKARGLLESTLVIWGGEFGRTATTGSGLGDQAGRDHHARCFSIFLAGGGVKGGTVHGETDELGMNVARDPVHVHDLHATILRVLGFDHTQLTYRYNGRDFRLTDNYGKVVNDVLA